MPRRHGESTAAALLSTWTDADTAMQIVGTSIGVFVEGLLEPDAVLSNETPLRNALFDVLLSLVEGGALEMRPADDGRYAFRWRADYAVVGLSGDGSKTIDINVPSPYEAELSRLRRERDDALGRAEFAEGLAAERERRLRIADVPAAGPPPAPTPPPTVRPERRRVPRPARESITGLDAEDQSVLDVLYGSTPAIGEPTPARSAGTDARAAPRRTPAPAPEPAVTPTPAAAATPAPDPPVEPVEPVAEPMVAAAAAPEPERESEPAVAPVPAPVLVAPPVVEADPDPGPVSASETPPEPEKTVAKPARKAAARKATPRKSAPRKSTPRKPSAKPRKARGSRASAPEAVATDPDPSMLEPDLDLTMLEHTEASGATSRPRELDEDDPSVVWLNPPVTQDDDDDADVDATPPRVTVDADPKPRRPKWSGYTLDKSRSHLSSVDRLVDEG